MLILLVRIFSGHRQAPVQTAFLLQHPCQASIHMRQRQQISLRPQTVAQGQVALLLSSTSRHLLLQAAWQQDSCMLPSQMLGPQYPCSQVTVIWLVALCQGMLTPIHLHLWQAAVAASVCAASFGVFLHSVASSMLTTMFNRLETFMSFFERPETLSDSMHDWRQCWQVQSCSS